MSLHSCCCLFYDFFCQWLLQRFLVYLCFSSIWRRNPSVIFSHCLSCMTFFSLVLFSSDLWMQLTFWKCFSVLIPLSRWSSRWQLHIYCNDFRLLFKKLGEGSFISFGLFSLYASVWMVAVSLCLEKLILSSEPSVLLHQVILLSSRILISVPIVPVSNISYLTLIHSDFLNLSVFCM